MNIFKRIAACLLLSVILIHAVPFSAGALKITTEVPEILLGDANNDGKVDILDATCIQRYLADYFVKSFNKDAAKASGGKDVTIMDATCIQRYLAGFSHPNIGKPIR